VDACGSLSARILGIPEAYSAMFSEDLLLSVNPAFTKRSIEALIDLQHLLPCESTVPTLVAVGEKENGLAKQGTKKVARCLKHAQGVIVPRVNHVWNLQAPDLFTDTVRAWIEDHPLPDVLRPLMKTRK
jgi:pimeloyl-ACP methyl ester carboxylesterase